MEGRVLMAEFELPPTSALPDAPMSMPKQILERRSRLFVAFRWAFWRVPVRP
jgi:hypothetical protein